MTEYNQINLKSNSNQIDKCMIQDNLRKKIDDLLNQRNDSEDEHFDSN